MFKELIAFSLGLIAGFTISTYNDETKEIIEYIIKKGKVYYEDLKNIIYQSIKSIEELDSDWIKLNYEKIMTILKDKLKDITELNLLEEKLDYATKEISNLFDQSKLKVAKNTINNTKNNSKKKTKIKI